MSKSKVMLAAIKDIDRIKNTMKANFKTYLIGKTCTHISSGYKCTITNVIVNDSFVVQFQIKTDKFNSTGFMYEFEIDED